MQQKGSAQSALPPPALPRYSGRKDGGDPWSRGFTGITEYIIFILTPCTRRMPFPFCQAIQVLPAHVTSSANL